MLGLRFYYLLKPFLPWQVRMWVRSFFARRKRVSHRAVWPINYSAHRTPQGWQGWPGKNKFAFVLTHDVEGPNGLAKCRQLAELELKYGFRSSFNFIPEGPYRVTSELRDWLTNHGFEVGVHDLQHDGKLFQSRSRFKEKSVRINRYLKEWGAVGFRAGLMLRKLDWIHDLDLLYDTSTFDTDPFEPQPDGVGTIFPFWIPPPPASARSRTPIPLHSPEDLANHRSNVGYTELPYTLPQDSTLYLLLGEASNKIWSHKLDWIISHGGMALLNVHPDYIQFDGEAASSRTYPVSYYREFLRYVIQQYGGQYWQPLPRELAKFTEEARLEHVQASSNIKN